MGSQSRKAYAFGMVLAFCGWIAASVLIACPFLQAELVAKHSCCPRTSAPSRCPLSKSIQDCPFYVTESKIGVAENIHPHVALPITPAVVIAPVRSEAAQFHDESEYTPDILLRIHVLRI